MSTGTEAATPEGEPGASLSADPPRRPPSGVVEEVLAMFAHSGPARDPLLEKIGARQIDRSLEIRAKREENIHQLRMAQQQSADNLATKCLLFLGFSLIAIVLLCWIFLQYGKTDQVFNLITLLFAGGGGVGIGYGLKRNGGAVPTSPSSDQDSFTPHP